MTAAQFSELFDIFTDKSVIFLRDQHALTEAEHLEFAGRFGDIYVLPAAREGRRVSAVGENPAPWLLDQDEVGSVDAPVRLTV